MHPKISTSRARAYLIAQIHCTPSVPEDRRRTITVGTFGEEKPTTTGNYRQFTILEAEAPTYTEALQIIAHYVFTSQPNHYSWVVPLLDDSTRENFKDLEGEPLSLAVRTAVR